MDAFTTPVDATISEYIPESERELINARNEIINLKAETVRLEGTHNFWYNKHTELEQKIRNVHGVIRDYYSENGEISDELKDIANYLDITLTKTISGSATCAISWSAEVPLDFDPSDFEICFSAECDTVEAEDFNYNEDDVTVEAEDDY